MKKFALKTAVLAIGALAGASAFAAISLDAASPTPNKYASELKIATTIDVLDGANTDLNLSATHGVAPGVNVTSYVRIDLSNGAKFKTTSPTLAVAAGASTTGAGTGSLSSGGAGSSYAIFALSPTTNTESIQADGVMTLTTNAAGITVANTGTVTARIRVFETLTAAANPDSSLALKDTTAKNFITFSSALSSTYTKGALTADVNPGTGAAYTKFTPVVAAGSVIGSITFAAGAAATAAGANATMANLLQDTSAITVTGDFTFLKGAAEAYGDTAVKARVFLNDASTCAGTTYAPTTKTVAAGSVLFDGVAAASLNVGQLYVCVAPEGTVAIPAGSYTAAITYVSQAAYTVPNVAATAVGDITRNGTTLIAPLVNQPAGWYSRLVLTNSGASDRTYAVTAVKEDGSTVTLTGDAALGTVKANTTKVINLHSLATIVAAPDGGVRTGLQVVVNGPLSQISGQYQIVSPAGNIANNTLVVK